MSEQVAIKVTVEIDPGAWDSATGSVTREDRREDVENYVYDLIADSDLRANGAIVSFDVRRKVVGGYGGSTQ